MCRPASVRLVIVVLCECKCVCVCVCMWHRHLLPLAREGHKEYACARRARARERNRLRCVAVDESRRRAAVWLRRSVGAHWHGPMLGRRSTSAHLRISSAQTQLVLLLLFSLAVLLASELVSQWRSNSWRGAVEEDEGGGGGAASTSTTANGIARPRDEMENLPSLPVSAGCAREAALRGARPLALRRHSRPDAES